MREYKVVFYVNNIRTETIVSARSTSEARKLVEAQYSGAKVTIIQVKML